MESPRCLGLLVCFLALICSVNAQSKYRGDVDAAYILGGLIIFMFFVFLCATGGPYLYKRFISGNYVSAYQPLPRREAKEESSLYVPPKAPESHAPLPGNAILTSHVTTQHTDTHLLLDVNDVDARRGPKITSPHTKHTYGSPRPFNNTSNSSFSRNNNPSSQIPDIDDTPPVIDDTPPVLPPKNPKLKLPASARPQRPAGPSHILV